MVALKKVIRIFQLVLLLILTLAPPSLYANHSADHPSYNHNSIVTTSPAPILAGIQVERLKVVETALIADRIFSGSGSSCIGCDSIFLSIDQPWNDFTLLNPLRELFSHTNANQRFRNKHILTKRGQPQVYFFEYTAQSEISTISNITSNSIVELSKNDPDQFYTLYGNRFISQRVLGEYFLIAYHLEFASDEEALFFKQHVALTESFVLNFQTILSSPNVDILQNSGLDGAVTIGVNQVGGDNAHFANYVDSKLGYLTPKSMSCAFSDLSVCFELYSRWLTYISDADGLSSSAANLSIDKPIQTHVIDYIIKDYGIVGLNLSPPTNPQLIPTIAERVEYNLVSQQLAEQYNLTQQQYERANVLLTIFTERMSIMEYNQLIDTKSNLQKNIDRIANIGLACVDFEPSCITDFNQMSLFTIDETALQITPISEEEMKNRITVKKPSSESGGGLDTISI